MTVSKNLAMDAIYRRSGATANGTTLLATSVCRSGPSPRLRGRGRYSPGPPVDRIEVAAGKLHVDRSVLDEIKQLLDDKGQVVLYEAPGTGKTYLVVELATAIADGEEDRLSVILFHPATTYEDFFEGLRPAVTRAGQVTYKRTSGPLMAIAEKAAKREAEDRTFVLVIDEINRANLPKVFGELLFLLENRDKSARTLYRPEEPFRLPANLKIIGTPGTRDLHRAHVKEVVMYHMARVARKAEGPAQAA